MDIILTIISLVSITLILFVAFKYRNNKNGSNKVVVLILLSSAAAGLALFLNSAYSILFYVLHSVLLLLALIFAIINTKKQSNA